MNKQPALWRSLLRGLAARNKKTVVPASAGEPVIPEALRIGLHAKDVAQIVSLHQEGLANLRALREAQKQSHALLGELRDALNTQITALRSLLQPARELSEQVAQLSQRTVEPLDLAASIGQDLDRRIRSAVDLAIADILTCLTDSSARVERCVEAAVARIDQRPQARTAQGGTTRVTGGAEAQSHPPIVEGEGAAAGGTSLAGVTPATEPPPSAPSLPTPPRRSKPLSPPLPPEALIGLVAAITGLRAESSADPEGLAARLRVLQESTSGPTPKLPASQWARDKIRQALKAAASDPAKADTILAALLSKIEENTQEGFPSPEGLPDNAAPPARSTTGQLTGGDGTAGFVESAGNPDESGLVIA